MSETFAEAAKRYLKGGGEARFLAPLVAHFNARPLAAINQGAVERAAKKLYPRGSPATHNRQVYTPISAVLKFAGRRVKLVRPEQVRRSRITLGQAQAHALIKAAEEVDFEFGCLCAFLWFTNCRLSIALERQMVNLDENKGIIGLRRHAMSLPIELVEKLLKLHRKDDRLFSLRKGGQLYILLDRACERAGLKLPPQTGFDIFRVRG